MIANLMVSIPSRIDTLAGLVGKLMVGIPSRIHTLAGLVGKPVFNSGRAVRGGCGREDFLANASK